MVEKKGQRTKGKRRVLRVVLIVAAAVLVTALCGFFVLLVKVKGNLSYVYNYFVKTKGSLNVVRYDDAAAAKGTPKASAETEPGRYLNSVKVIVNGETVTEYERS